MLLSIGKLLTLVVAGGGGITAYYLTKPSSSKNDNYQGNYYLSALQDLDCSKPYLITLDEGGLTFTHYKKELAEEFLQKTYGGKGKITLKQNPKCPSWASLPKP